MNLLGRLIVFCDFTEETEAFFFTAFDVDVALGVGGGSFFFTGGCGLAGLSDDSDSELLSEDAEEPVPDAELLELAELSDFAICLVTKPVIN